MAPTRVDSVLVDVRDEAQLTRLIVAGASIWEVYEPSGLRGHPGRTYTTQLVRIPLALALEMGIVRRLTATTPRKG